MPFNIVVQMKLSMKKKGKENNLIPRNDLSFPAAPYPNKE